MVTGIGSGTRAIASRSLSNADVAWRLSCRPMSSTRHNSKTIPIGWIGGECAPTAERYQQAINLQSRGRIVAAFADCREVADRVAGVCGGKLHRSFRSFCQHAELGAILCLEAGWLGVWGLDRISALSVPILVVNPLASPFTSAVIEGLANAERDGCALIPAMVWRMTPAMLRLRELLATRLGPIRRIDVELRCSITDHAAFIQAIDWCRTLLVFSGGELHWNGLTENGELRFRGTKRTPETPEVAVTIRVSASLDNASPPAFEAAIETERGHVCLQDEIDLRWTHEGVTTEETLDTDRPAEQVMLDLFLRRVVGGLVPAPSWGELLHVVNLWKQFERR